MADQPSVRIPEFSEINNTVPNTNLDSGVNEIYFYSFSTNSFFNFKAYLTDYSDQYQSNWTPQDIYGRMDPIFTYKNTVRKITLGFDVPSQNKNEAASNTSRADLLIKSLYPVYNYREGVVGSALIGSPPLFKIKFANLIANVTKNVEENNPSVSGLLGWIDGFNFKPELDSGVFVEGSIVYPKLFKVNFTFNVIHEHALGNTTRPNGVRVTRLEDNSQAFAHSFDTRYTPAPPPPTPSPPRTRAGEATLVALASVPAGTAGSAFVPLPTTEQQQRFLAAIPTTVPP